MVVDVKSKRKMSESASTVIMITCIFPAYPSLVDTVCSFPLMLILIVSFPGAPTFCVGNPAWGKHATASVPDITQPSRPTHINAEHRTADASDATSLAGSPASYAGQPM